MVFQYNTNWSSNTLIPKVLKPNKEDYCYTVIFEGSFYPAFRHEKELYYIDDN